MRKKYSGIQEESQKARVYNRKKSFRNEFYKTDKELSLDNQARCSGMQL